MKGTAGRETVFRFGLFEADPDSKTLTRSGVRVKIQEQPFRLLLLLVERSGEVITRDEMRQALWPEGTYVDFDGSLNVILKRLRAAIDDEPDNPRFIETIPRRGYRFVAPVSIVETPSERDSRITPGKEVPATGVEASASPAAVSDSSISFFGRSRRQPRHLMYAASILAVAIAAGGWLAWHYGWLRGQQPVAHNTPINVRKSVAVLGFRNLSGRTEDVWLATALSEMLTTELAGGEKLRLVPGEQVASLRPFSRSAQTDTLDPNTTARIGAALNSDVLVLGSYLTIGPSGHNQLRLDVRMQDGRTGEILQEVAEVGSTQDLFQLVARIGAKLRERLGVKQLQSTEEAGVLASMPLDPEVARFYALGVTKLREFDALAAKDLLEQAVQADPKFSLAHSMLAQAWAQLGYEQKRREEAKKAFDLAIDLPRAQHMLVEGEYYESLGNQEQAASVYHALFELFPDNIEYGLQLAEVLTRLGHSSQTMEVVHQIRRLPVPSSDDPRIDLIEADVAENKPTELALIHSAMNKSSLQGKKLVYALARKRECLMLNYTDHPEQAFVSCQDAYEVFMSAGNRLAAADCLRMMADTQGTQGHSEQAIATYQRALAILEKLGDHEKTGALLNNMAINFENEGKLDRAEQLYRQAKSHFEQAGDPRNAATVIGNIADIFYARGDLSGATKLYQQGLQAEQSLDPADTGYFLYRLADLNLTQGQVGGAERLARQAIDAYPQERGAYQYRTSAMIVLGETLEAMGKLAESRRQFEEALATQQKMGARALAAESQLELALLAIEENHPELAESAIGSTITAFEEEKNDPDASHAYTLLSRALLMQGKLEEARKAARRGTELSLTSSDPALKLPAAIQQARVEMAKHQAANSAAALRDLQAVIATAKRLGYYTLECEAQLALGQLELRANASLGRKHLAALAAETRSRGLELLARQAEGEMTTVPVVAQNQPMH